MNAVKAPQHMHPLLELPKDALTQILPHKDLSVLKFLSFKLPAIMVTTKHMSIEAFFSEDQPSLCDAQLIQDFPIPPTQTLDMLSKSSSEAVENGASSLKCAHLAGDATKTRLPLWVLTYCMERRTQLWKNEEGEEARRLVAKIYNALTCISWSGKLGGFAVAEPVVELTAYATDEWLSDVHENQMLNLLWRRLQHQPQGQKIEIENIYFYGFLKKAYEIRSSREYEG
ncbi:hypothetical protein F4604DRAFT_1932076 [Suillus subluteus]|nr:hypothetical protein F4604DRAFT_1932076 [Suillus subluteus]